MSSQVVWSIVKKNSAFLRKQGDVEFSANPLNLNSINSSRFSGVCDKALSVSLPADSKERSVLRVKTTKKNKPAKATAAYPLRRGSKRSTKAISTHASGYRSDLQTVAVARWNKVTSARKTRKMKSRTRTGPRAAKKN
eukprot:g3685.t1